MCTVSVRVCRRGATALANKDLLDKGGLVALGGISASLLHSLTDNSTVAILADFIVHNELLAMCFAILAHRVAVRSVGVRSVLVRNVQVRLVVLVMAVVPVTPATATATA